MKHLQYRNAGILLAGMMGVGAVQAQTVKASEGPQAEAPIPAITDWSSRSVVHRKPKMPDEFARGSAGNAEMQQLYRDPRYVASLLRRIDAEMPQLRSAPLAQAVQATAMNSTKRCRDRNRRDCNDNPPSTQLDGEVVRDWSNVLGGGANGLGGSGMPGVFPAKYNFNITATPSCANDFVVYPTNAAGATASGTTRERRTVTFSARPGNDDTIVIGTSGTPRSVTLTAVNTATLAQQFARGPNTSDNAIEAATNATNLALAVNRFSGQTGISATSSGAVVTLSQNTFGNNNTLPITNNLGNTTLSGNLNGDGAFGQPTVIAFNQLYQGTGTSAPAGPCNGTWNQDGATKAPNVLWAYNTGVGAVAETSPVLSYLDNGRQVAFIQRTGNTLELVLLKPQAGQGTAGVPIVPANLSAAAYQAARAGAATAMHKITLPGTSNSGNTATFSAPFVDYADDVLWVGDGNGRLHKYTGIFQGTPAQASGFPVTLEAGLKMSPPVSSGGMVYIGSQSGTGTVGGKLYRVNATTGAVAAASAKLALNNSTGVRESPIVDAGTGQVYTFVFNDNTSTYTDTARCGAFGGELDGCRAVIQFDANFAASSIGTRRFIGRGNGINRTLYAGAFDDAFYASGNGTGAMYIVGGQAGNTFYATLWRIPIVNGVLGTPAQGHTFGARDRYQEGPNANSGTDNLQQLSPATMIKNGTNEYLFVSTASYANATGCGNGQFTNSACMYMYNLADLNGSGAGTGMAWGTGNAPAAALAAPGGTGGIVVDNTSGTAGSSQIYFTQLQSGGNAIQASQSGLQ